MTKTRLAKRASRLAVSAAYFIFIAGCAGPRTSTQLANPATLNDDAFQAYLATVDLVTVEEAYRAMLILADGQDNAKSFEERKDKLEARGIVRPQWRLQTQNVIDAGSIAYMTCQVCKITGGVNKNLFGTVGIGDRRYALRELVYRGMISDTVDYQFFTGAEFVSLLAKSDALMAKKGLYPTKGVDLSDEKDRDEHGNLIVPGSPRREPTEPK